MGKMHCPSFTFLLNTLSPLSLINEPKIGLSSPALPQEEHILLTPLKPLGPLSPLTPFGPFLFSLSL